MFDLTPDTPLEPVDKPTLIIAMTARVGSTNLCSVLSKLGPFGTPEEIFNPRGGVQRALARLHGCTTAVDYLRRLAAETDIFCFKVCGVDWAPFAKRARALFPRAKYVYLDRFDRDAQAISLYRAKQTNRWHATTTQQERAVLENAMFDPVAIANCRAQIETEDRGWRRFFFNTGVKPLCIAYEHMCEDMAKAVQMICAEAGVSIRPEDVPPGNYRITRDAITEEWKRRLRSLSGVTAEEMRQACRKAVWMVEAGGEPQALQIQIADAISALPVPAQAASEPLARKPA